MEGPPTRMMYSDSAPRALPPNKSKSTSDKDSRRRIPMSRNHYLCWRRKSASEGNFRQNQQNPTKSKRASISNSSCHRRWWFWSVNFVHSVDKVFKTAGRLHHGLNPYSSAVFELARTSRRAPRPPPAADVN